MIKRVFFGEVNGVTAGVTDIKMNEKFALAVIVILIVVIGVYPKPMLELTKETADYILTKMNYKL